MGLGIAPRILGVLEKLNFKAPTPIQAKSIPVALEGKDIIGLAQTGTGKTMAFSIPMIQLLAQKGGMGLILSPTRELAQQIEQSIKPLVSAYGMRAACLIGGAPFPTQKNALRLNPNILIATPGRFIDHMEQGNILMPRINMLVLDEADRMLDMGFAPQIEKILRFVPKMRQTLLFSATMPEQILKIVHTHMKLPIQVEIARTGTTAEGVSQELYIVKSESKRLILKKILEEYRGSVLIFVRTKHLARKVNHWVRDMGHRSAEIHSDRTQGQRRMALEGFKSGYYRILVATDIAARGLDVTLIELIINYDLPDEAENYVHRIGRAGRAGAQGHAISFATPEQKRDVKTIERLIRKEIPIIKHPHAEEFIEEPKSPPRARSSKRGFKGGRHFRAHR